MTELFLLSDDRSCVVCKFTSPVEMIPCIDIECTATYEHEPIEVQDKTSCSIIFDSKQTIDVYLTEYCGPIANIPSNINMSAKTITYNMGQDNELYLRMDATIREEDVIPYRGVEIMYNITGDPDDQIGLQFDIPLKQFGNLPIYQIIPLMEDHQLVGRIIPIEDIYAQVILAGNYEHGKYPVVAKYRNRYYYEYISG